MTPAQAAWKALIVSLGILVLGVGAVEASAPMLLIGVVMIGGLPAMLRDGQPAEVERARRTPGARWINGAWVTPAATLPPAYPEHPGVAPLTRRYLAGTIDVDQYTEQVEALPWTPTDSHKWEATPQGSSFAHSGLTAGAATSTVGLSLREAFTGAYIGAHAPSSLWRSEDYAPQDLAGRDPRRISAEYIKAETITTSKIHCNSFEPPPVLLRQEAREHY